MATHRYGKVLTIVATSGALVLASALPAQAVGAAATTASVVQVAAQSTVGSAQTRAARRVTAPVSRTTLARAAALRAAAVREARARRAAAAAAAAAVAEAAAVAAPVVETPAPVEVVPAALVASSPAGSPSGVSAPRGDLPGWTQTYAEDFTTDVATGSFPGAYGNHWYAYTDGLKDTSRNGTYMPSKVMSVHDGVLDWSIRTEAGKHLVSAPVLKDTYGQVYGRYSVRFRADRMPGYKTAWLLWPDSDRWPADGEIDFPEGDLDGTIGAFNHYANAGGGQDGFDSNTSFNAWHTATIEWIPGKVTFTLDDKVLGISTTDVPTTAMHWVLQTETTLSGSVPAAGVAGHVLVDWVALYKRA